ncbi:hypothetical protein ABGA94_12730, partial [Stenotrophomonas sp. 3diitr2024]
IEELMARIRAVSRRPSAMVTPSLRVGRLEFDFESLQAQVEGQPLALPRCPACAGASVAPLNRGIEL